MSIVEHSPTISREWNGTLMTAEEFDAATDWDEEYSYELINGVLIVTPSPSAAERGPNDLLAQWLRNYRDNHPEGSTLNRTLPEHTIATGDNRRRADRVIWCGLGRQPDVQRDVPQIVVEMVSADRRDRRRDYETKRSEYSLIGVREYWIMDRFQRRVTICRFEEQGETETILSESDVLTTPLLPGFELPLSLWFAEADLEALAERTVEPMRQLKSCGVVLFRKEPVLSFLLMKHADRWDLPKGHVDEGETELQCALREMEEETGIPRNAVRLDETFRFAEIYYPIYKRYPGEKIEKTLVIFLGWLDDDLPLKLTEHAGHEWLPWNPPHRIQKNTIDPLLAEVEKHFAQVKDH